MTKTVSFEGKDYGFPDDATDAEIGAALNTATASPDYSTVIKAIPGEARRQLSSAVAGADIALGDVFGSAEMKKRGLGVKQQIAEEANLERPPNMNIVQEGVLSGGASALTQFPAMGVAALASPVAAPLALLGGATTAMGIQTGLSKYGDERQAGFLPARSALHGLIEGLIEKYTEYLPLSELTKGNILVKEARNFLVKEMAGEQLATLGQDINAKLSDQPDMTLGDYFRDALVTAIATPVAGGAQLAIMKAGQVGAQALQSGAMAQPSAVPSPVPADTSPVPPGATPAPSSPVVDTANAGLSPPAPVAAPASQGSVQVPQAGTTARVYLVSEKDSVLEVTTDLNEAAMFSDPVKYADVNPEQLQLMQEKIPAAQRGDYEGGARFPIPKDSSLSWKSAVTPPPVMPAKPTDLDPKYVAGVEIPAPVRNASVAETVPINVEGTKAKALAFPDQITKALWNYGAALTRYETTTSPADSTRLNALRDKAKEVSGITDDALIAEQAQRYVYGVSILGLKKAKGTFGAPALEKALSAQKAHEEHIASGLASKVKNGEVAMSSDLPYGNPWLKQMQVYLQAWVKTFSPNMRIVVLGVQAGDNTRARTQYYGGTHYVYVPQEQQKILALYVLAHEFGHMLVSEHLNDPKYVEQKDKLIAEYTALITKTEGLTAGQFVRNFTSPIDVITQDFDPMMTAAQHMEHVGQASLTFDEWMADQLVRYVHTNRSHLEGPGDQAFWKPLFAQLKGFFERVVKKFAPTQTYTDWVESLRIQDSQQATASRSAPPSPRVDRSKNGEMSAKPGVNFGRLTTLLGSKLYGNPTELTSVSVKEMVQNAFDAIKGEIEAGRVTLGKLTIKLDEKARSITVTDNGSGMAPEILASQFLQIAGTHKTSGRASGGLGIAKGLFLYGNQRIVVKTVHNGTMSILDTTGEALMAAADGQGDPVKIRMETTNEPNGTSVMAIVPPSFIDPSTNEQKEIGFNSWGTMPVLDRSPLLENIVVTRNGATLPIGANFPMKEYGHFANVNFTWGEANIYVLKKEEETYGRNTHILSNGLWQFSMTLAANPLDPFGDSIPRQIYVNVAPKVKADQPGYPFDLNRQQFSSQAQEDFNALFSYLSVVYRKQEIAVGVAGYGSITYIDSNGLLSESENLVPSMSAKTAGSLFMITENDEVRVEEGKLYVNNRLVPTLTKEDLKTSSDILAEFKIEQDRIHPDRVMLHNNVVILKTGEKDVEAASPLPVVMRRRFGTEFDKFLYKIGMVFHGVVQEMQKLPDYALLHDYAKGISFDQQYRGVHTNAPFVGIFVNPAVIVGESPRAKAIAIWLTMVHEITHLRVQSHNADFVGELQKNIGWLETLGVAAQHKDALTAIFTRDLEILETLELEHHSDNAKPRGKHLPDVAYERGSGRSSTDVVGTGERAVGDAGLYERTENFPRDPTLGPISPSSVGEDSVELVDNPAAPTYRSVKKMLVDATETTAKKSGVPGLPETFKRFQGFLQSTLQLNQIAKLLPEVVGLQRYRTAMRSLHALKAKLFEGPNDRIHEWHKIGRTQAKRVEQALRDEQLSGEHWTALVQTDVDGRQVWVHTPTASFDKFMRDRGINQEGQELFLGVKNDYVSTLTAMEEVVRKHTTSFFEKNPDVLSYRLARINEEFAKLRSVPYLPDMRFGQYSVQVRAGRPEVVDGREIKTGELVFWEKFESERARNRRLAELKRSLPGHNVSGSYDSELVSTMRGLPQSVMDAVAETLNSDPATALTAEQKTALEQIAFDQTAAGKFAKYLGTPAKHIAGSSKDMRRAYAAYHWKTANAIAKLNYFRALTGAMNAVRADARAIRTAGGTSDPYDKLAEYMQNNFTFVMNPTHEFEQLRAFVSLWYLWGSAKTAAMNLTSVPVLTFPYLWARFGNLQAQGALLRSIKDVTQYWRDPSKVSLDHQRVLEQLKADGVTDQSFASMLASVSDGGVAFEKIIPSWEGAGTGEAVDIARRTAWRITSMGMAPFRVIEQFNRQITGLAAYDLMVAKNGRTLSSGDTEAYNFARDAVDYTQNEYGAWNRPPMMQGKQSIFLLFFSFVQNMSFMMFGGDKSWWRAMLVLGVMAGLQGLPGMDNLLDLFNWTARKLSGQHVDLRNEARSVARELGMNPDMVMHGISHNWLGLGWDTSTSVGAGRIIPGTDAIFGIGKFEDRFLHATSELGGPVGSLMLSFLQALADDNPSELLRWDRALPPVLRNIEKSYLAITNDAWTNARGRPVAEDPTGTELVGQSLGFSPTRRTERTEELRAVKDIVEFYKERRTNLMEAMWSAKRTHDTDVVQDVRSQIATFNAGVPSSHLRITPEDVVASMKSREKLDRETQAMRSPQKRYRDIYRYIDELY